MIAGPNVPSLAAEDTFFFALHCFPGKHNTCLKQLSIGFYIEALQKAKTSFEIYAAWQAMLGKNYKLLAQIPNFCIQYTFWFSRFTHSRTFPDTDNLYGICCNIFEIPWQWHTVALQQEKGGTVLKKLRPRFSIPSVKMTKEIK